ncbi:hypothetical protein HGRIS_009769 [Hohenbuehelia grisea]|uniref:Zn(2)-C6 fungal-type domain-containing protein n=1 Tax=Hohenbuehelia grisea TaxID=104357 RepID=A0ABR3J259_9AGAR
MSSTAAILGRPPKRVPMACRYCRKRKIKASHLHILLLSTVLISSQCEPQTLDARGSCKKCLEQHRLCEYVPVEADQETAQFIPYMSPTPEAVASHDTGRSTPFGGPSHAMSHGDSYSTMPGQAYMHATNHSSSYQGTHHNGPVNMYTPSHLSYGMTVPAPYDQQPWPPTQQSISRSSSMAAPNAYPSNTSAGYPNMYPSQASMHLQQNSDPRSQFSASGPSWPTAAPANHSYAGMASS